ncbi:YppF family protein [Alteribacter populi]|uniref:YppF family protein n=1 Tax=Alteribacter populi TaxID=2011011 RepID=UPI0012FE5965|nr:YppF family protein [Alteribacter populi]
MTLKTLIDFYCVRFDQSPTQVNDLMDLLAWCYVSEFISPSGYKSLLHELEKRGAEKPEFSDLNVLPIYA